MSKLVLDDLASLSNEQSALSKLNSNWQKIEDALENTLSRDGTSPNSMSDDLDMNSNRVINLPAAASDTEPVRKAEFDQTLIAAGIPIDGEYLVRSSNSLLTSERVVTNSDSVVADWSTDAGQVRFKRAALTGDVIASQDSNVTELAAQAKTYINVLKYGASPALSDNSVAFQAAIDAAYSAGGGIVFVPAGTYKLTAQVTIKSGVTVDGIGWRFDQNSNTGQTGTVFEIRWGSGSGAVNDVTKAAFILNANAGFHGILVTYPLQAIDDFTPDEYGPTLKLYDTTPYNGSPYLNNVHIEDVMLHKAYCGIDARGSKAGLVNSPSDANDYLKLMTTHRFRKVLLAPLRYGVRIDNVTDWSIFEDIEVQPGYLAPVGTYALGASLRDYAQKNCIAFELGSCDWLKLNSCTAWAVNYAVVIAGHGPFTFIGCEFDACRSGNFYFTGNCSPTLFEAVGCTFTTFDALEDANNGSRVSSFVAVIGPNTTVTSIAFDSCRLFGPSKGWLWADQTVRTVTRFALRDCTTSTHYWGGMSADYAIKAGAAAGFSDAIIVGNTFTGLAGIYDGTITNLVTDNNITDSGAFTSAPSSAEFLVKTANNSLSAERVVSDTASVTWDWATVGQTKANVEFASLAETQTGTSVKSVNVLRLLDRLKYDGYLSVRHFGVALDGSDESVEIDAALAESVPLLFPATGAVIPVYQPMVVRAHGGIIGHGEGTLFERRFSGGPVISYPGGEPIILRDFKIECNGSVTPISGDNGVQIGFTTPWAQRGSVQRLFIANQFDGFKWKGGTDGPMEDITCHSNRNRGFLGVNPRGKLVRCLAQFNGTGLPAAAEDGSGYAVYFDTVGETGFEFDHCGAFANYGYGYFISGSAAGANIWGNKADSSFDRLGGVRAGDNALAQFEWRNSLIEYAGQANDFRPDFPLVNGAVGITIASGVTNSEIESVKVINCRGSGVVVGDGVSHFALRDTKSVANGLGGGGNGVIVGAATNVELRDIRAYNNTTTDVVVSASATGVVADVQGGTLDIQNNAGLICSGVQTLPPSIPTIASAATLTLPNWADVTKVSGSTAITSISASWAGREVTLIFTAACTITNGNNLKLSSDFNATTNRSITLVCDGVNWYETGTLLAAENVTGVVELASTAETQTGTDTTRAVTPSGLRAATREKLTANRTYYVRTDGSDSNNGLSDTAGGAFLTLQKAWDVICDLDMNIYTITVQVRNGTYSGVAFTNIPIGTNSVVFQGDTATPSNVLINSTNGFVINGPAQVTVKGFKLTCSGNGLRTTHPGAVLMFGAIDFGACGDHIRADFGYIRSLSGSSGNYTISGGASRHVLVGGSGKVLLESNTATLTGTPAFIDGFMRADQGNISLWAITWSGSATGVRYYATLNGVINSFGQGTASTWFPGNSNGSTSTGGQQV